MKKTIRVFEAFAGYGSQAMALKRLEHNFPDKVHFDFVGISEIDKYAIAAYRAVHGDVPNYGDITKINWGGQMPDFDLFTYSFPCFTADTLVHTKRGIIPIAYVKAGDYVLAHDNEYHVVTEVGSRGGAPIIKLRAACFDEIKCTPNHPFYARKKLSDGVSFSEAEWVPAESLTKDHYVGYAINQKSELPELGGDAIGNLFNDNDFWYIIGRYVGDGWIRIDRTQSHVVICCSDDNLNILLDAIRRCGWGFTLATHLTLIKVYISNNALAAYVEKFGFRAFGKCVSEDVINLPANLLTAFVNGVIDSDSCMDGDEFKISTISKSLAYGLQQCISKAYKVPVRMHFNRHKSKVRINGFFFNREDVYCLLWHSGKRSEDKAFYEDGYIWSPIREITDLNKTATVYNMEVKDAHSYTANGAIVHNCTDISSAGKQAGFTEGSGTRSSLLWECKKAIEAKHPKYLLMENVKAIKTKKFLPYFLKWLEWLKEQGYSNFWSVLNAKDYCCPQNRERCFVVSILDKNASFMFPNPFPLEKRLADVLEEDVDESFYLKPKQVQHIVEHCARKVAEGCGFKTNFTPPQGISGAIKTKEGSREYDTYLIEPCGDSGAVKQLAGWSGDKPAGDSSDTYERTRQLPEGESTRPPEKD